MCKTDNTWQWSINVSKSFWNLNTNYESKGGPTSHAEKHVQKCPLFVTAKSLKPDDAIENNRANNNTQTRNYQTGNPFWTLFGHERKEVTFVLHCAFHFIYTSLCYTNNAIQRFLDTS